MAGKGLRLVDAGFEKPKPLVEIKNKTIMEWSINSLNLDEKFIFCCILGNNFLGLFNGILHVLLLLVAPEKLKEMCC